MNFAEMYLAAEKYDEVEAIGGDSGQAGYPGNNGGAFVFS